MARKRLIVNICNQLYNLLFIVYVKHKKDPQGIRVKRFIAYSGYDQWWSVYEVAERVRFDQDRFIHGSTIDPETERCTRGQHLYFRLSTQRRIYFQDITRLASFGKNN